jgi:hypothetical protein
MIAVFRLVIVMHGDKKRLLEKPFLTWQQNMEIPFGWKRVSNRTNCISNTTPNVEATFIPKSNATMKERTESRRL